MISESPEPHAPDAPAPASATAFPQSRLRTMIAYLAVPGLIVAPENKEKGLGSETQVHHAGHSDLTTAPALRSLSIRVRGQWQ